MPIVCYQCGVCTRFCPNQVIEMVEIARQKGIINTKHTDGLVLNFGDSTRNLPRKTLPYWSSKTNRSQPCASAIQ